MPTTNPSIAQLQRAIQITEQMGKLEAELKTVLGDETAPSIAMTRASSKEVPKKKRTMSASARARIAAAQKARWAKSKGVVVTASETKPATKAVQQGKKKRRKMSPEARARIVAAQKKRWAKFRKGK